jgi:hypothetical protein
MNHVSQEALDRGIRIRQTQQGARSTMETRVALIIAERGLTKKQLAKFYLSRRKNSKPRFDYWAFAEAYGISKDWLYEGDLRSHPRGTTAPSGRRATRKKDPNRLSPIMTGEEFAAAVATMPTADQEAIRAMVREILQEGADGA